MQPVNVRTTARAVLIALALAGCGQDPTAVPDGSINKTSLDPSLSLSDGANGGTPHFFFLPPLVKNPHAQGTFDPTVTPTVSICALTSQRICDHTIATYTVQGGPGGERVRVNANQELYAISWKTGAFQVREHDRYRIRVFIGPTPLGRVDVEALQNAAQFRNIDTRELIPLSDGRILPIRFRLERGGVSKIRIAPAAARVEIGDQIQFRATLFDFHGQILQQPNLLLDWSSSNAQVMKIDLHSGVAVGVSAGAATIVAHLGLVTSDAASGIVKPMAVITFVSNFHIWVMSPTGTLAKQLTGGTARDGYPTWSPDGTRITFVRNDEVHVMNANGSGITQLTFDTGASEFPRYSPDGTKIAYNNGITSGGEGISHNLNIMNPDGSAQTFLADNGGAFTWSPDSKALAFLGPEIPGRIKKVIIGVSGITDLSMLPAGDEHFDHYPQWSPDGKKIAFSREDRAASKSNFEIFVMNADGSGKTQLTFSENNNSLPNWSPDGKKIAFIRVQSLSPRLWVMNSDGTDQKQLTFGPGYDGGLVALSGGSDGLAWSSDSKKIVFQRQTDDRFDVYRINADGTGLLNLTAGLPGGGREPEWMP